MKDEELIGSSEAHAPGRLKATPRGNVRLFVES